MKALPAKFIEEINRHPQYDQLIEGLSLPPEVSIRLNLSKCQYNDCLCLNIDELEKVDWCNSGYYLSQRPNFTFDPTLHQGIYYVQDASSMSIQSVIQQICKEFGNNPLTVLDACAAPGGKSTAILSALPPASLLVSNEYDFRRAEILAENIAKWGKSNVLVSRGDTARFSKLKNAFDIILIDAPCSGEGMMRKDEKAIEQWSPSLVESCAATQRQIIDNVWKALKPGGFLIYSTCTFNTVENEDNLRYILDKGAESVSVSCLENNDRIVKGIDIDASCYHFLPGKIRGEGLFLSVVRKEGNWSHTSCANTKDKKKNNASFHVNVKDWLKDGYDIVVKGEEVYALPENCASRMAMIADKLDIISYGTHIAAVKGKDVCPAQPLALSEALDNNAFPTVELSTNDAIKYLRKENIDLPLCAKGYVLLTYKKIPLGFVKNLGNRSNNLYPKNWRIISNYPAPR